MAEMAIVAGAGLSAASSLMAGKQGAEAAAFEGTQYGWQAQQYDLQGKELDLESFQYTQQQTQIKTAGAQAEAARRNDFTASLETIQAIRAGRNVGEGSPTGQAIYSALIRHEASDVAIEKANYAAAADEARINAGLSKANADIARGNADLARMGVGFSQSKAKYSLISGYIGAASALTGGVYGLTKNKSYG